MNYKDYQNARDAAWRLLIDCNITVLPVKISEVCRQIGIPVKMGNLGLRVDGQSLLVSGQPVILISKSVSRQRGRFTIAHELGHILQGHLEHTSLAHRGPNQNGTPIEQAANVFAARVLAPACVLWACGVRTPEEIARMCDISHTAAKLRAERMEELYKRNKFLTSPLERKVCAQFQSYIEMHRVTDR